MSAEAIAARATVRPMQVRVPSWPAAIAPEGICGPCGEAVQPKRYDFPWITRPYQECPLCQRGYSEWGCQIPNWAWEHYQGPDRYTRRGVGLVATPLFPETRVMDTEKLKATLRVAEGDKDRLYDDATGEPFQHGEKPQGTLTVGVGHNCEEAWTPEAVEYLLSSDVAVAVTTAQQKFPGMPDWEDARQRAVVELLFNMGGPRFESFVHMTAALNAKDWPEASKQLLDSAYAKELPTRAGRIAAMIRTGADPDQG